MAVVAGMAAVGTVAMVVAGGVQALRLASGWVRSAVRCCMHLHLQFIIRRLRRTTRRHPDITLRRRRPIMHRRLITRRHLLITHRRMGIIDE
jgi:hypothetical protein